LKREIVDVVAALIWDKDKFLICQCPVTKDRPLLWEFVGGKVESGETNEEALIRECYEELDIKLDIGNEFMRVEHEYIDITVNLILFNATISSGVPKLKEHNDLRWIKPSDISNFEFCPADKELIEKTILFR